MRSRARLRFGPRLRRRTILRLRSRTGLRLLVPRLRSRAGLRLLIARLLRRMSLRLRPCLGRGTILRLLGFRPRAGHRSLGLLIRRTVFRTRRWSRSARLGVVRGRIEVATSAIDSGGLA